MHIYGIAFLAVVYLSGQFLGEILGNLLGLDANVGGVGFAMIILLLLKDWLLRKNFMSLEMEAGIEFWNKLFIPVVIAMAASLNVKLALTAGSLALVVGMLPVFICFFVFPVLLKPFTSPKDGNIIEAHP
jgi:malonate transporter MadL subunit